jgi:DNA-binding response OmpR family regulator
MPMRRSESAERFLDAFEALATGRAKERKLTVPHVLVVEPHADVRHTVSALLEDRGYRVSSALDGATMRRELEGDGFDAIVLAATLYGEDAASLARHARNLRLPVVMMISGHPAAMEFAGDNALQLLRKPFRRQELYAALDQAFASGEFGQRGFDSAPRDKQRSIPPQDLP